MSANDSPEVSWEENDVDPVVMGEMDVFPASDMMQEEEEEDSDDDEARSEAGEKGTGVKP